jgi:hypothetical protein
MLQGAHGRGCRERGRRSEQDAEQDHRLPKKEGVPGALQ